MRTMRHLLVLSLASYLGLWHLGGAEPPATSPSQHSTSPVPTATTLEELFNAARSSHRTDLAKAIAHCDHAIQLAPSDFKPHLWRAGIHDFHRQHEAALKDASEAIRLEPSAAEGWQLRGTLHFKLRRFRESVADFDRYLDLVPSRRADHWQRGISLYYAGEFKEGREQFELHATVNPSDVENTVWHFLCVAGAKNIAEARAVLLRPGRDSRIPMREILALFDGTGKAEDVLAAAARNRKESDALFYAHLYLGLYFDVQGDRVKAREHIGQAVTLGPQHYMGDVARVHARVLEEQGPVKSH